MPGSHCTNMRCALVGERDERAVRAAAEVLADRFVQRRLVLQVIVDRLADGITLFRVLQENPSLRTVFDGGLVVVNSQGVVLDSWQPGITWSSSLQTAPLPWTVEHDAAVPLVIANARSADGKISLYGG